MDDKHHQAAYVAGLKLLARRELSALQVRQRLLRRAHPEESVDAAIDRLRQERALDDARVAHALARHEISTKRHGRLRAQRQIEAAGIPPDVAKAALDEALADLDEDALLEAALRRRLRGSTSIDDEAQFRRLYRYLIGQGFDSDRALRALRAKRR